MLVSGTGPGGLVVESVSAGDQHTCALVTGRTVHCWGENRFGELGDGTTGLRNVPTKVSGSGTGALQIVSIGAGSYFTCATTTALAVWCWGEGSSGKLASSAQQSAVPVQVTGTGSGSLRFAHVSAGMGHACGLTAAPDAGKIYCWGLNLFGGLGNGTSGGESNVPVLVSATESFISVEAATNFTCALSASHSVYCWGRNLSGELGNGTTTNASVPKLVATPAGIRFSAISADGMHACAIANVGTATGDVYCWGSNSDGQWRRDNHRTHLAGARRSVVTHRQGAERPIGCSARIRRCKVVRALGTVRASGDTNEGHRREARASQPRARLGVTAGVICLAVALALSATGLGRLGAQGAVSTADAARYAARRARAYERLGENLLVIQSRWSPGAANQPGFDQDATFYYYTGAGRLIGAVLVLDGATRRAELFLPSARPGTYVGMSQADLGTDRAASLRVDAVSEWRAFAPFIERRLADHPRLTIHVDDGGTEAASAGRLASPLDSLAVLENPHVAWHRSLQRRWPNAVIVTDTAITATLRAVKDSSEIAVLRRVAENSVAAFFAGLPRFGPGRRQRPVEAAVVEACTRLGDGPSFWPWVMTGPNAVFPVPFSSALDQHNLDRAMRAGEVARFDLGCKVDRYMGDVGRTLPVTGTFTPEQREVIDVMAAMYRAGLAVLRDGVEAEALLRAGVAEARRLQGSMRTPLGRRAAALLMQPDSLPYWQTHGVGLDHAEPLPAVLRAGMVLAYEPIFTVGAQGFYMEDMILVTPTGYEILTKGLPTTAGEIEQAMRRRQR